jgi:hypothetical protein
MKSKSKLLVLAVMTAILVAAATLFVPMAFAAHHVMHQVDPSGSFTDVVTVGNAGVTNAKWAADVPANDGFQFNLILGIAATGKQPYPQTVTYGVTAITGPGNPVVYFDGDTEKATFTQEFTEDNDQTPRTIQVNIIAPAIDGGYTVKIFPTAKTGGNPNLIDDYGITISFTVIPSSCTPIDTSLSLILDPSCVVYKATSTTFAATLTYGDNSPLANEKIDFTIEGIDLGSVVTDVDGKATIDYDPSGLAVGGYTVTASFQGDGCYLKADPASASLGVRYDFLGFQPPVRIDGAGAGLFSGKVIPVKIRIANADGYPVPDATAYVTWSATIADVTQTDVAAESVSAADSGNRMRYDPVADQYIYNWDVSALANGDYTINIDMGEGCGGDHNATVKLHKRGGNKKK